MVKIIECPRDAMQGHKKAIPTELKIKYLNALLKAGFDTLDCISYVSPKAVPQLADSETVLQSLDTENCRTKILCIVANERGAEKAASESKVDVLGFPFSISETFQLRNTNQTIKQAEEVLKNILKISEVSQKEVLVYLSMGFGNPYGDEYNSDIAYNWCSKLSNMGVGQINLSDTIGKAGHSDISRLFSICTDNITHVEFGAHFHTRPDNYLENIQAAYENGCRKFDAAIRGFGGCPFADDELTGNLPTEQLVEYLGSLPEATGLDMEAFKNAYALASEVFE